METIKLDALNDPKYVGNLAVVFPKRSGNPVRGSLTIDPTSQSPFVRKLRDDGSWGGDTLINEGDSVIPNYSDSRTSEEYLVSN